MKPLKQDEAWHKRQTVWKHNGRRNAVTMCLKIAESIAILSTATDEAKDTAANVAELLKTLHQQMEKRTDQ